MQLCMYVCAYICMPTLYCGVMASYGRGTYGSVQIAITGCIPHSLQSTHCEDKSLQLKLSSYRVYMTLSQHDMRLYSQGMITI